MREQQHPLVYDLNLTVGVMATRLREAGLDNRAMVVDARVLDDPPRSSGCACRSPRAAASSTWCA